MADLVSLGELLIDFVPQIRGVRLREVTAFQRAPGGAPANVAVGFSKLGGKSVFISKVGEDEFGYFLKEVLEREGVETTYIFTTKEAPTGLAFVSLRKDGERDFIFYRNPAADMLLRPEEIEEKVIAGSEIFHFGSISLISEPSRGATLLAAEYAVKHHKIVSFDPNLRPPLWPGLVEAKKQILGGLKYATILKVSQEELEFITGEANINAAAGELFKNYPALKVVAVTLGKDGCLLCLKKQKFYIRGFSLNTVDATGAGDGFTAGLLSYLHREMVRAQAEKGPAFLDGRQDEEFWRAAGRFANAAGGLVTTKEGAIPGMPDRHEVERLLAGSP